MKYYGNLSSKMYETVNLYYVYIFIYMLIILTLFHSLYIIIVHYIVYNHQNILPILTISKPQQITSPQQTLMQPFDNISQSADNRSIKSRQKLKQNLNLNLNKQLRQPLLKYRIAQQQKRKQLTSNLKDNSMPYYDSYSSHYSNSNNKHNNNKQQNKLINMIPLINPQSQLLILWNIVIECAVLFNFFMAALVVTFRIQAYNFDINTDVGLALNGISLALLYIDLAVRFNVGFYNRQKLITQRILISHHYLHYQFWIDALSCLALTIYMAGNSYSFCYVKLVIYIRVYSLVRLDQSIQHGLSLYRYLLSLYKLMKMVIIIWMLTTWAGCIFFAIDYSFYQDPTNVYNIQNQLWLTNSAAVSGLNIIVSFPQWFIWYQYSLYWSIQTSSTTGYGDLTPMNPPQVMYCNVVMLLMTVMFAYFINYVWVIIRNITQDYQNGEKLYRVQRYLKQANFNYNNTQQTYTNTQDNDNDDINETQMLQINRAYNITLDILNKSNQKTRDLHNRETRYKIQDYVKEVLQEQDQIQMEQFIIQNISDDLRDQFYIATRATFLTPSQTSINTNMVSDLLSAIPIVTASHPVNLQKTVIKQLAHLLTSIRFTKQQQIYNQADLNSTLYYLRTGLIKLEMQSDITVQSLGKSINPGQLFEEEEFFMGIKTSHSATAITYVKLWALQYQAMRKVFKNYTIANQFYCLFQQQFKIYRQFPQNQSYNCWKCQQPGHKLYQCQVLCFQRSQFEQIAYHNRNQNSDNQQNTNNNKQQRNFYVRKDRKSMKLQWKHRMMGNIDIENVANFQYYHPEYNVIVHVQDVRKSRII